jgi:hypothetical protein
MGGHLMVPVALTGGHLMVPVVLTAAHRMAAERTVGLRREPNHQQIRPRQPAREAHRR